MAAKDLANEEIRHRLEKLYADLGQFPPGVSCAWPLGRVFNELLKQVKREHPEDPVINAIAFLRENREDVAGVTDTQVGTVRALTGQLVAAVEWPGEPTAAEGNSAARKPSARSAAPDKTAT